VAKEGIGRPADSAAAALESAASEKRAVSLRQVVIVVRVVRGPLHALCQPDMRFVTGSSSTQSDSCAARPIAEGRPPQSMPGNLFSQYRDAGVGPVCDWPKKTARTSQSHIRSP